MKKPMFLLPMGWNPTVRHVNFWRYVSEGQEHVNELCQAIMVPCDGWEPVSRTASLQHVSAPGPPLSSIWKSLSRGSTRWPCAVHSSNHLFPPHGQRQGSAPDIYISNPPGCRAEHLPIGNPGLMCTRQRGLLPLPASACCRGHPPSHQQTSRHQPGQSSQGLDRVPVCLRWLTIQLDETGTWEERQEDREVMEFAVDQATGQWHSWKEPAGCLAWLQSTGQGSFCPLSLVASPLCPLHLLDRLHPCFSSICRHIHHLCVWKNKLAANCHGLPRKKNQLSKQEVGVLRRQETLLIFCQMSSSVSAVGAGLA